LWANCGHGVGTERSNAPLPHQRESGNRRSVVARTPRHRSRDTSRSCAHRDTYCRAGARRASRRAERVTVRAALRRPRHPRAIGAADKSADCGHESNHPPDRMRPVFRLVPVPVAARIERPARRPATAGSGSWTDRGHSGGPDTWRGQLRRARTSAVPPELTRYLDRRRSDRYCSARRCDRRRRPGTALPRPERRPGVVSSFHSFPRHHSCLKRMRSLYPNPASIPSTGLSATPPLRQVPAHDPQRDDGAVQNQPLHQRHSIRLEVRYTFRSNLLVRGMPIQRIFGMLALATRECIRRTPAWPPERPRLRR
jgi:hypothetical protein